MTADTALLARPRSSVKSALMFSFERLLDELLNLAEGDEATPRSLEVAVWGKVVLCRNSADVLAFLERHGEGCLSTRAA